MQKSSGLHFENSDILLLVPARKVWPLSQSVPLKMTWFLDSQSQWRYQWASVLVNHSERGVATGSVSPRDYESIERPNDLCLPIPVKEV